MSPIGICLDLGKAFDNRQNPQGLLPLGPNISTQWKMATRESNVDRFQTYTRTSIQISWNITPGESGQLIFLEKRNRLRRRIHAVGANIQSEHFYFWSLVSQTCINRMQLETEISNNLNDNDTVKDKLNKLNNAVTRSNWEILQKKVMYKRRT